ncbi:MAG TPA: pyridoxamine 5'-phosphate oxidase family protein [Vicinamibacterales bacterium]|jgi:PPOX class probable FMN-dependent enzyme
MPAEHGIASIAELRECYTQPPHERARRKSLRVLDSHMRNFIALSPFLCMGTSSEHGADVTPRGDQPGFVHVLDDNTILIPDWPGNNRLDSLTNIVSNPHVGLLLFIPGVDETLRINGVAEVTTDPDVVGRWKVNGKHPRSALRVTVREAFLHCAKALIRSHLWGSHYRIDRQQLPSYGQMLKDQTGVPDTVQEIQASIDKGYRDNLY